MSNSSRACWIRICALMPCAWLQRTRQINCDLHADPSAKSRHAASNRVLATGFLTAGFLATAGPFAAPPGNSRKPFRLPSVQVGLRHDLDDRAREALKQEVCAGMNAFQAFLEREQASFKLWVHAIADWETQRRSKHTELAVQQHDAIMKVRVGKAD